MILYIESLSTLSNTLSQNINIVKCSKKYNEKGNMMIYDAATVLISFHCIYLLQMCLILGYLLWSIIIMKFVFFP